MTRRTALVTGASRGIGASIEARLKADGFDVFAPRRSEVDLADAGSVERFCSALSDKTVDVLVNDAGINNLAVTVDIEAPELERMYLVNLWSAVFLTKAVLPSMVQRGFGRIVNVSSIWARITRPGRAMYSLTKAGLEGFTRSVAVESARHNVLVNAIAPGYTDTELTRQNNPPNVVAEIEKQIPIGRLAQPNEIAELVAYLAGERNTYITGQTITIDGGFSIV